MKRITIQVRLALFAAGILGWVGIATWAETAATERCTHDAPKELCFICDPALREKGRLWCPEHDRYEDRCWECHADLKDSKRTYCEKHHLYEDECFLCRPELKEKPKPEAASPSDRAGLICKEHDVLEDECGICHPELAASIEPGSALKVRFASSESASKAGVQTARPQVGALTDGIECYAEIEFNQNRLAQITMAVDGLIRNVEVDLGALVKEGDLLARISSAAIGEAVARASLAKQSLERERKLRADRISSERDLQEAEAAYMAAHQLLITLGFDNDQIESLPGRAREAAVLEVRAPFAGEIIERSAVQGARVEAGQTLFVLTDRSTVWAMLNIPEAQLTRARLNQPVELRVDALPDQTFRGTLTWVAAQVDDRTRMARARAEIPNPDGALRAKMFARARLVTGATDQVIIVPESALQVVEGRPFVFVKTAEDLYEARPVRLGARHNGRVEVQAGVGTEDEVVVVNGFSVKSQLLIARLGAGCVD